MSYCTNCGFRLDDEYGFCPECGNKILSNVEQKDVEAFSNTTTKYKRCKYCNEMMPEDSFYCLSCGRTFDDEDDFDNIKKRVSSTNVAHKNIDTSVGVWKNKWISLLLCIFFGVFGVHRFYEEKRVTGFIYLFTFGIFGIGWFIDIILIATKPNPYRVK